MINLASIVDRNQPVPGTPTAKWGYSPARRAGYLKMTDAEYRGFGAINASLLKCPTLSEMYSMLTAPHKDTAALAVGTLADLAIVSGMAEVEAKFHIVDVPINDRTGKPFGRETQKAEAAYAEAAAAHPEKYLCSLEEWEGYRMELDEIVTAFRESALCMEALENAMLQVSGVLWHPVWNCWVKWKPDVLKTKPDPECGWIIPDLKTSRRHVLDFKRDAFEFGYFDQSLWYKSCHEDCMRALGLEMHVKVTDFLVVAKSDDGRRPRQAMARRIRVPLDPQANLLMKASYNRLFPEDGFGRVEMFLGGLRAHLSVNPHPEDRAALRRIWTAYEHEERPFVLCEMPKSFF